VRVDPSICQMSKLNILYLSGNKITELPAEIGAMKFLKELYVAANFLNGLPESVCEMKGLEMIDLRQNRLCYLPSTLKALNFLERIILSDNPSFPLPKELEEKKTLAIEAFVQEKFKRFAVAHAEMRGRRWNMEDALVTKANFRGVEGDAYLAVFDGHGGDKAALYAAKRHPEILEDQLRELEAGKTGKTSNSEPDEEDIIAAIKNSFVECGKEMTTENIKRSGTTAVVCVCLGNKVYVANVGDSRAVIAMDNGKVLRISVDHKPDHPEEEKRIRNLGGFVSPNGRVVGMLAVSRAFGDLELQPFVSAEPHVAVLELKNSLECLVMACDGIWDVVSDEAACVVVKSEGDDLTRGCMKLRDFAYSFGSLDNISVIAVKFK